MSDKFSGQRAAFRKLHQAGCFVLPNPWDVGSAKMLQHLGFCALASTSSGLAWSKGRPDYEVSKDDVLQHLTEICGAVDLPVNADFESGFAAEPEGLASNIQLAVATGVAGISIEDRAVGNINELYSLKTAVERIRVARAAIDATKQDVILVARTEGLLLDSKGLTAAIDKLVAFAAAGADCLYAPGVSAKADIAAMVKAVEPKPLNVLVVDPQVSFYELEDLGVRRISVGGFLATTAWAGMIAAAEEMKAGSFKALAGGTPSAHLNQVFGPAGPLPNS